MAKICHNLRPYGVSSILCDETGKLSQPVPETNQANILVKGSVVDDKNGFHTNDTLRIPRSKIITPSKEIPAFDRRCKIGALFAVLIPDHFYDDNNKSYQLRFKICYIATRRVSIDNYCSKRLYAHIKLGTFRCVGISDCRKDIYSYKATNQTEEHTYFPNFVFGPANQWVLPSCVKYHRADIHKRLYSHGLSSKIELLYEKTYGGENFDSMEKIYPMLFEKLSVPGLLVSCLDDPYLPTTFVELPGENESEENVEKYKSLLQKIALERRGYKRLVKGEIYVKQDYITEPGEDEQEISISPNEYTGFSIDGNDVKWYYDSDEEENSESGDFEEEEEEEVE